MNTWRTKENHTADVIKGTYNTSIFFFSSTVHWKLVLSVKNIERKLDTMWKTVELVEVSDCRIYFKDWSLNLLSHGHAASAVKMQKNIIALWIQMSISRVSKSTLLQLSLFYFSAVWYFFLFFFSVALRIVTHLRLDLHCRLYSHVFLQNLSQQSCSLVNRALFMSQTRKKDFFWCVFCPS